jgi:hypothetical protein
MGRVRLAHAWKLLAYHNVLISILSSDQIDWNLIGTLIDVFEFPKVSVA